MPVNAALATDQAPRPVIRMQAPDAPAQAGTPLALPSPEALGVAVARTLNRAPAAEVDWNNVRSRLRRLGAVGFHLDQVDGQWRATLLVPAGNQAARHVEASAANDAAAVAEALQKAETSAQLR